MKILFTNACPEPPQQYVKRIIRIQITNQYIIQEDEEEYIERGSSSYDGWMDGMEKNQCRAPKLSKYGYELGFALVMPRVVKYLQTWVNK